MRLINLSAVRWFRAARKDMPEQRSAAQSMPERCRETFASEVSWFASKVAKAQKRDTG